MLRRAFPQDIHVNETAVNHRAFGMVSAMRNRDTNAVNGEE